MTMAEVKNCTCGAHNNIRELKYQKGVTFLAHCVRD